MGGLLVYLLAGGGAAFAGLESALKRPVESAINHGPLKLALHVANLTRTRLMRGENWQVDPIVARQGRDVDVLWTSPDCKNHSNTKGSRPWPPRGRDWSGDGVFYELDFEIAGLILVVRYGPPQTEGWTFFKSYQDFRFQIEEIMVKS